MLTPVRDMWQAVRGNLRRDSGARNSAIGRLGYLVVIMDAVVVLLAGLVIWHPMLFESEHIVRVFAVAALVAFFVVQVAIALLIPRLLLTPDDD
ncbi:MAG: hypothetical protein IRZ28_15180 [Steroidobacteraceae bacterium]|jgi:hypothetical protein|nr:hypothetical protein [Steroidobacteraceae bacterium]